MVKTYTIESTDHRARMSEHEDGPWVPKAVYDAIAAELTGYKESHDKYCPSAARVRVLEAALREYTDSCSCQFGTVHYDECRRLIASTTETTAPACLVDDCYYDVVRKGYCARHWKESAEALAESETEPKPKCNHSLNQGTTLQRIENMIDCTVCGKTWQEIAADNSARFQDDRSVKP